MSDKPKTKKECFAQLDEMLSEEDKMAIMQAEDTIEFLDCGFVTTGYTTVVQKM